MKIKEKALIEYFGKKNLDGSTLDDDEIVKKLRNRKIAVSNEFEYHPLR